MAQLDYLEIKDSMLDLDYNSICQQDDDVCTECIESARAYVKSVIKKFGISYDEDDSSIRLALKKRTMAEMYTYAAEWNTAEVFKGECNEILSPLAPVVSSSGEIKGRASGYVRQANNSWNGY